MAEYQPPRTPRLQEHDNLGQNQVDLAHWCWVRTYKWSGVSIEGLTNLRRWLDAMKERPACRRGVEVPFKLTSIVNDEKAAQEFAENARQSLQR